MKSLISFLFADLGHEPDDLIPLPKVNTRILKKVCDSFVKLFLMVATFLSVVLFSNRDNKEGSCKEESCLLMSY